MQAVVVADGVARDVVDRLRGGDIAAGAADDDDDLALVVEPLASRGTHDTGLVRVERGDGLVEVRRGRGELGHELLGAAGVVEVHRDDLGGLGRGQVDRLVDADLATVTGHQGVALAAYLAGIAVEQDAAVLRHQAPTFCLVQPLAGRSNQTWTWLVPIAFS